MKRSLIRVFIGLIVLSFSAAAFSQNESQGNKTAAAVSDGSSQAQPAAAKPVPSEWLYGEVNSVDISGRSLVLTYLDYDTDIEKQATVYVDAKTIFENVKSFEDIKPQDMASIDYVPAADNKYLAVAVSVEQPESVEDLNPQETPKKEAPAQEIKPVEEAPVLEQPANPSESAPVAENPASTQEENTPDNVTAP